VRRSVGYKSGLSRSRSKSGKGSQAADGERIGAGAETQIDVDAISQIGKLYTIEVPASAWID
jgi:hypothetical protein